MSTIRLVPRIDRATGRAVLVLPDSGDRAGAFMLGCYTRDEGHSVCARAWYRRATRRPAAGDADAAHACARMRARRIVRAALPHWRCRMKCRDSAAAYHNALRPYAPPADAAADDAVVLERAESVTSFAERGLS